jgi:hypothetical protein
MSGLPLRTVVDSDSLRLVRAAMMMIVVGPLGQSRKS